MQRAFSLVLVVLVLSIFLSPLQRELYIGDETKYSQVVREMDHGSFFLPTLEGSPFTHKPPLHFWIVSILTKLFDTHSIWPFVLPSLLSFALLLLLMRAMEGPAAAFVCGTGLMVWGSAQTARMDVAFTALLALSAWMIWRGFQGERTLPWAGLAAGLAFLFKGPMAPVIAVALYVIERWRRRRSSPASHSKGEVALAAALMLAIPLLWLIPAIVIGGEPFWREIFFKQTVGRAVGAWVHKSPPWFYIVRAPMTLAPWFLTAIVGVVAAWKRDDEQAKFGVSWMLAVLIPYTLLSSKLDVYMIAMIPAVALVVARLVAVEDDLADWGRRANLAMLLMLLAVGFTGLVLRRADIPDANSWLIELTVVRGFFAVLFFGALLAIVVTLRWRLPGSTMALGLVPVAALAYAAVFLVPVANEGASTRPVLRALEQQAVPPREIALYASPHLWVRGMNPAFDDVKYVDARDLATFRPSLLVVRRKNAREIANVLRAYRKVDEVVMAGKSFDVYRR
jgi:4-amino-4-deoxy-L-arabinose transferase-like glycosyltransferase